MTSTLATRPVPAEAALADQGQDAPPPAAAGYAAGPPAVRAIGITFGGTALLNAFLAAGAAVTALGPLLRPHGSSSGRLLRRLAGAGALAAWAYTLAVRPWFLRWGADAAEIDRAYPGDELVPHAVWRSTRAVTIAAPAQAVWPWLVQMGQRRAGLYSYDWLENLAGLDIHSTDRIVPELQHIEVGDFIPAGPGEPEGGGGWTVAGIDPGRALILRVGAPSQAFKPAVEVPFIATWAFVIDRVDENTSRLIARWRASSRRGAFIVGVMALTELPHFVMERKMLLGIKARAERARP